MIYKFSALALKLPYWQAGCKVYLKELRRAKYTSEEEQYAGELIFPLIKNIYGAVVVKAVQH